MIETVRKRVIKFIKDDSKKFSSDKKLININTPPLLARRFSAYNRTIELISEDIFSYSKNKRIHKYIAILKLLNDAINASQLIFHKGKNKDYLHSYTNYLKLLRDIIQASSSLIRHDIVLKKEEKGLSNFIGKEIAKPLQSTDEIFKSSEKEIYESILELTRASKNAIFKYEKAMKTNFNKKELERYDKAYNKSKERYASFGYFNEQDDENAEILKTQTIDLISLRNSL